MKALECVDEKACSRCKVVKPLSGFCKRHNRPLGYSSQCKQCLAQRTRTSYKDKPHYRERQREWSRTTYRNLKALIIKAYGGVCVFCQEAEPRLLSIDHIYGDGAESRRRGEGQGGALYLRLKREGFPKDRYQLMCLSCNFSKRQYGTPVLSSFRGDLVQTGNVAVN